MIGSSFYRANEEKCPRCGAFGRDADEADVEVAMTVCPSCSTRFNQFVILQEGQDVEFQNH